MTFTWLREEHLERERRGGGEGGRQAGKQAGFAAFCVGCWAHPFIVLFDLTLPYLCEIDIVTISTDKEIKSWVG